MSFFFIAASHLNIDDGQFGIHSKLIFFFLLLTETLATLITL